MPSDYSPNSHAPAVTIDVAGAYQALSAPSYVPGYSGVPGGRPPGRINDHGGPAIPGAGTTPNNANATLVDGEAVKKGLMAVAATAAACGIGFLLYQDHKKVTLARNGGEEPAQTKKRKKSRAADDEDEDDDD